MFRLDERVAVVTGAGAGIGAAIALVLARQGAGVAALDRDLQAASQTVETIRAAGGRAEALAADVSDAEQVRAAFQELGTRLGRIDILVNNAGINHVGSLVGTSEADFDRVYAINVKGVFLCAQAAVPFLLKQGGGVIVNMGSIAALIGLPDRMAYSMSKGAVLAITRAIAVEYMKQNIRCNCICPTRVHTPLVDGFIAANYPGREEEMFRQLSEYQPMGRMGTPEEVAHLALYLCSDEARFITGQAYPIDGGVLVS
jgi:2-keto-3-deoxy-L-fuconate dehydrogenase